MAKLVLTFGALALVAFLAGNFSTDIALLFFWGTASSLFDIVILCSQLFDKLSHFAQIGYS
jgi:hypothetical protein